MQNSSSHNLTSNGTNDIGGGVDTGDPTLLGLILLVLPFLFWWMYKRWRGENINPYQCGHGCGQMVEGFVEGVRDAQQGDNQNGPGSDGAPSSNLMDPDVDGGKSRQRSREH